MPPAEIQRLRDQTRLRKALANDRTRRAQRLHTLLTHEGWPCARSRLLTATGRRWIEGLNLDPGVRAQADVMPTIIAAITHLLEPIEAELRGFAHDDPRCRAPQTIYGVGPIVACHLLAEIGDVLRVQRPRQLVRASGLDPAVIESADSKRPAASPRRALSASPGPSSRPPSTDIGTQAPTTPPPPTSSTGYGMSRRSPNSNSCTPPARAVIGTGHPTLGPQHQRLGRRRVYRPGAGGR
jgi:hypothetical protein